VYRLAGLRLESRELLKRLMGIGGTLESRVRLLKIYAGKEDEIKKCLNDAFMIVPAFGYRPRTVPMYSESGRILFSADNGGPLVNKHCQVIGSQGEAIPNVYGVGLASGFVPWGAMGGEPGFKGQTNGLWLYQNNIGEMILKQLMNAKQQPDENGLVKAA
jgi:hypothetical protein